MPNYSGNPCTGGPPWPPRSWHPESSSPAAVGFERSTLFTTKEK